MVTIRLASSLARLLPEHQATWRSHTTVAVEASSWMDLTRQIRSRYPALADRILTGTTDIAPGFVLVVNDVVTRRPQQSLELTPGDEVCIFPAVAGG